MPCRAAVMEPVNRLALQLDAEVAAVITAMRANAKWAVVPGKYNVRGGLTAGQPLRWPGCWLPALARVPLGLQKMFMQFI